MLCILIFLVPLKLLNLPLPLKAKLWHQHMAVFQRAYSRRKCRQACCLDDS